MRQLFLTLIFLFSLSGAYVLSATSAWACGCGCCGAVGGCATVCACTSKKQTPITRDHVTNAMNQHRRWMVDIYFKDDRNASNSVQRDTIPGILAAMKIMTNQLTSVALHQVMIIGAMLDAKHQMETQRLFQQMTAEAHKDYHPSEGMCDVGTTVRSLMSSERKGDIVAVTVANRLTDRQLLTGDVLSNDAGTLGDKYSRLKNFIKVYCNPKDNNMGLDYLCKKGGGTPQRQNKDVNYTQTVETPLTLKIDLTKDTTEDTQDLLALSANLFAHDVTPKIQKSFLKPNGDVPPEQGYLALMASRSIAAKRSVAQNTIASIAALKAEGSPESKPFVYAVLKEMGGTAMEEDEIKKYLGDNPSYFAQMEVLTKKIHQNPVFFTELYDKPANVMRKQVAMQAVELMQKRDMYRSLLRSESVFSVMLETAISQQQQKLKNEVDSLRQDSDLFELP
jgi:hypothetical protein